MQERINKYLADKKIASRREADEYIGRGLVYVNGKKATLGQKIDPERDTVEVKNLKNQFVYYAYNKPTGIVTTTPQKGEIDIIHYTHFPHKVFPIGRLDKDSHGLIILTNDRKMTTAMIGMDSKVEKEYVVKINEKVTDKFVDFLKNGVRLDEDTLTKKCKVSKIAPDQFSIILTEGKNRQIRRMVSAFGYTVADLKRVRIGKVFLRTLKPGSFIATDPKLLA
jgi:23S rRNA pseudouridine2604 synthase